MAAHCSILAWEISMDRGDWRATVHGVTERQTCLSDHAQPGDWKRRDEPRWQQRGSLRAWEGQAQDRP